MHFTYILEFIVLCAWSVDLGQVGDYFPISSGHKLKSKCITAKCGLSALLSIVFCSCMVIKVSGFRRV